MPRLRTISYGSPRGCEIRQAYLWPPSVNSLLAGLLPVPYSSSAKACFALGVISLLLFLIVSCPASTSEGTETFLVLDADDSPILPGLDVSERLCGIEIGDEGPAMPAINGASGKLSSGCRARRVAVLIVYWAKG